MVVAMLGKPETKEDVRRRIGQIHCMIFLFKTECRKVADGKGAHDGEATIQNLFARYENKTTTVITIITEYEEDMMY